MNASPEKLSEELKTISPTATSVVVKNADALVQLENVER